MKSARVIGAAVLLSLCPLVTLAASLIGQPLENVTLQDYRGKEVSLSDFQSSRLVVLAFLGTECPLAKLYAGRLEAISRTYQPEEVVVLGIDSNVQDSPTEIDAFVRRHEITFPMLKDVGNRLADKLGAERTPQVFLLDQQRIVRYSGRIDDQYVVGIVRKEPDREDLRAAIQELLAGQSVSVATTTPLGCLIGKVRKPDDSSPVTYSGHIARIFHAHCVECHRPGEIAPFELTRYEDVVGWGPMIAEVVREQRMPPWHADPRHGKFANDTSLTAEEKDLIATWVENGCPQGDPAQLPPSPAFVEGWQLPRAPDVVIAMRDKPFQIPADAGPEGVRYQRFWVDPKFTQDHWVDGAEIRPGNRAVVHHVIVYMTEPGTGRRNKSLLTAYVPGLRLQGYPPGAAKRVPAGTQLQFEVHYTPIGSPQQDLTTVGLLFADPAKVTHEVRTLSVGTNDFKLKPFEAHQSVSAQSARSAAEVALISMSPHMHLRGESFRYEAQYPDGTSEILLDVPHYDFNWQTRYQLATPKIMPVGSAILCTATYDNSAANLANPDPAATVVWGDQSWEEMMLGYMDIMTPLVDAGNSKVPSLPNGKPLSAEAILQYLDANGDGQLTREETAPAKIVESNFDKVDTDRDGLVTRKEIEQALVRFGLVRP